MGWGGNLANHLPVSVGKEHRLSFARNVSSGTSQSALSVPAKLHVHQSFGRGKSCFSALWGCCQFLSLHLWNWGPCFVACCWLFSATRGPPTSIQCELLHGPSHNMTALLLGQRENFSLQSSKPESYVIFMGVTLQHICYTNQLNQRLDILSFLP